MPLVGFEPTVSTSERPQTYTLDRATTGIGQGSQYAGNVTNRARSVYKPIMLPALIFMIHV